MRKGIVLALLCVFVFSCKGEKKRIPENKSSETLFVENKDLTLAEGALFRLNDFPSEYIKPRPVDVWVPENYSEEKKYAVLYMHDGQMLFDSTTTWNKQEWKVDEWASKLMHDKATKDFIVVGIHSVPDIRWHNLFPQKALESFDIEVRDSIMSNALSDNKKAKLSGDHYLKFLIEELKPLVDNEFSTLTDKKNTFVAGSSMGGLMSMYAICEYPEVFSRAACISTHWPGAKPVEGFNPIADAILKYMKAHLPSPEDHRLYFDYGTETLDAFYPKYAPTVDSILIAKGYNDTNFKNLKFEGTDHSENSWNQRLDIPLTFLLGKDNE